MKQHIPTSIWLTMVLLLGFVVGYIAWIGALSIGQEEEYLLQPQSQRGPSDLEACIQVVAPARNPKTGEVKNFPTACDVPEGWEIVE